MNPPSSKHDPTSHVPVPYPEEHRDWWRVFTQVTQPLDAEFDVRDSQSIDQSVAE